MDKCRAFYCDQPQARANPFCYKHWVTLPNRYKEKFKEAHNERGYERLIKECRRQLKLIEDNYSLDNYPFYPKP